VGPSLVPADAGSRPNDGVGGSRPVGFEDLSQPRGLCGRRLNPTFRPLVRCRGVSNIASGSAQILVDESGRRRRVLRWSGRAVSVALLVWLGLLALGTLGLQPLGHLPVLGQSQPRSSPPALPARIEAAAARGAGHHRAAPLPGVPEARPGRLDPSRDHERVPRPTRDRSSGAGASKVLPASRPGTSGAPLQRPATIAPSVATGTAATSTPPSGTTGVAPGSTGAEHGASTSSPGLTDSAPGQVKPDGAPAAPPVPTDPGRSAEHPPQGRDQTLTIPTP
jgi:hypothetical protein